MSAKRSSSKYDVALSFAGEDRPVAAQLARRLRERNLNVFYDAWEQATLWGQDLHSHLTEIFRSSRYCVILLSAAYAEKSWTRFEMRAGAARASVNQGYQILPVTLDDSPFPTILSNVGYLDLRRNSVAAIADMIAEKVKASSELPREEAGETSKESLHVIPRKDGWAVKRTGASRALRIFGTQREAIAFALDFLSGKVPHEVVIHKKDGTVGERMTTDE